MEKRKLGASSLSIAPLAFGGNVFGWTADEATSFKLLDAFVDHGFDFIDSADVYSIWVPGHQGGESESVIGNWLKRGGRRDKITIATKVGKDMREAGKGLSKAYIVKAVEASLKRLATDHIDLYQSHDDDVSVPLEESLGAFDALIKSGKVRAIGASNYEAPRLAEALAVSKAKGFAAYQSLQPHYNLATRQHFESGLQKVCLEHGLGVIPYFSLASGFLTGKYRSKADTEGRPRAYALQAYANDRGFGIVRALDEVASRLSATPAQIALAWLLAQPAITAPIVSATSVGQLEEIVKAVDIKLDADALATLEGASR